MEICNHNTCQPKSCGCGTTHAAQSGGKERRICRRRFFELCKFDSEDGGYVALENRQLDSPSALQF